MTAKPRTRGARTAVAVLVAVLVALTGCSRSVDGSAMKAGGAGVPRNDNAEKQFPNLLKECEVLTTDVIAKTVGADPMLIQSTFVGAICRWQAQSGSGLIDITRFWFERGDLAEERKVAEFLKYKIESRTIQGRDSILMRTDDPNGACGVASDAMGAVGWWVNPQVPGVDACPQALKLMDLTLNNNS